MDAFAKTLAAVPCLTLGLLGALAAAPDRARDAGVDFWNTDAEQNRLEAAGAEARRLEAVGDRQAARLAESERLASGLCDGRLTLDEAVDGLAAVANDNPDWFATLRSNLCSYWSLPQTAADRDVLTRYLRGRIASIQRGALESGDASRAAFVRERLIRFDEEVSRQGISH